MLHRFYSMQDVLLMSESFCFFCCGFFVFFLVLKTLKELNRAKDQIFSNISVHFLLSSENGNLKNEKTAKCCVPINDSISRGVIQLSSISTWRLNNKFLAFILVWVELLAPLQKLTTRKKMFQVWLKNLQRSEYSNLVLHWGILAFFR